MGVDFSWHSGHAEPVLPDLPSPPRRRLRWRRWLLALLLPLVAAAGLAAWRVRAAEEAARADLQRVVEREVAALAAGQREELLALLTRTSPLYWCTYHNAAFNRESAWYAARGAARVRVERVRLEAEAATVQVALDDGERVWRGTWHYRLVGGAWRHGPPPAEVLGERCSASAGRVTVTAQGLDEEEAARLAMEVEALCSDLARRYNAEAPLRIAIEVAPSRNGSSSSWWPAEGGAGLSVSMPSPQLGLELLTAEERREALGRAVRLAVASEMLGRNGRGYPVSQALALWHAQAGEPEWEAYARAAAADGTWRRYIDLWEPEGVEADEWWREVFGRYEGVPEGALMQAVQSWAGAMSYSMGEYLATHHPPERLAALLRVVGTGRPDVAAELGLTRDELEAEWGAFLQGRLGGVEA